ncbi:hypothetical protein Celaphus_00003709 [Cervus elaphus hippelaphus]|uniref:Uncharacterized protein n=1 Tax=Cervus elaphus hippelaphus TaxID=46360 RepID=A0A212D185_CEREH|nr:hypothetical protein Celaphus_00003709 [Cervus elaphus hippelaphus]
MLTGEKGSAGGPLREPPQNTEPGRPLNSLRPEAVPVGAGSLDSSAPDGACFKSTVEKTNLCCPSCHCQIAFWTWYHTQRNSLVNMELWEIIKNNNNNNNTIQRNESLEFLGNNQRKLLMTISQFTY